MLAELLIFVFGVSLVSGLLGSLMLWFRAIYFGELISHVALFSVVVSEVIHIDNGIVSSIVAVIYGLFLMFSYERYNTYLINYLLIVFSLTIGILCYQIFGGEINVSIDSLLLGNIFSISISSIYLFYASIFLILLFVGWNWNRILIMSVCMDMYKVYYQSVMLIMLPIIVLCSVIISYSISILGSMLASSIVLVPAIAASYISRGPLNMVLLGSIISLINASLGVYLSFLLNLSLSIAISSVSMLSLIVILCCKKFMKLSIK